MLKTINAIDRIYGMFRRGELCWLIAKEAMIELGAYRITNKGFAIDGTRIPFKEI